MSVVCRRLSHFEDQNEEPKTKKTQIEMREEDDEENAVKCASTLLNIIRCVCERATHTRITQITNG